MNYCIICGQPFAEEHHITKRSQAKFMINCKYNKVNLCAECHRGKNGVHGKNGHILDLKLRLEMQQKLEILLDKQYFTREDIKSYLEINDKATDSLCKLIQSQKGMFYREDVIRACMNGKLVTEDEVKLINESTNDFK